MRRFLVAYIFLFIILSPLGIRAQEGTDVWNRPLQELIEQKKEPLARVIKKVDPTVVFLQIRHSIKNPKSGKTQMVRLIGSGFVVKPNGFILTNAHLFSIKGYPILGTAIKVKMWDGRIWDASVIKKDGDIDIALLKINTVDLPTATLGDSNDIEVGQTVIAIGNPTGLEHSVTKGIISAINREKGRIQTSAHAYHGSSGGPLFNEKGEVIGIIVSGVKDIYMAGKNRIEVPVPGINFAIPINYANNLLALTGK